MAEVMMTSYSEEVPTPKTPRVEFVKPSTSSTSTRVPGTLQVRDVALPLAPTKGRRILHFKSQSLSDVTSRGVGSQVYSGPITRSRAKALKYTEVTSHLSITTLDQDKDQFEEQDKVTSLALYDIRTLFQEEEPLVVIPQD